MLKIGILVSSIILIFVHPDIHKALNMKKVHQKLALMKQFRKLYGSDSLSELRLLSGKKGRELTFIEIRLIRVYLTFRF